MILLLDEVSREELVTAIGDDGFPSVYIVAPAQVGPLEWLATDERRAQGEAEARVLAAEWLLAAGKDEQAVVALREAVELFDRKEATAPAAKARARIEELAPV